MIIVHRIARYVFCLLLLGSAYGEITRSPVVLASLQHVDMPEYLLNLLAPLKVAGALTLLAWPGARLREWAYAGFAFNLFGALFCVVASGPIAPDIIILPVFMALLATAYFTRPDRQRA